ncbi:MAG: Lpg1974 family pore-forming outer membrane protein, partial [Verrucomicrobiota bacterium]
KAPALLLTCVAVGLTFFTQSATSEETVTIPMSTYQDLMERLDSLEKRMNESEARDSAASTAPVSSSRESSYAPSTAKNSILDETIHIPTPKEIIPPTKSGGLFVNYEYVHAKPVYSNATAFYTHDTVIDFQESAVLEEFDYDLSGSHRYELGYLSPSSDLGWSVRFWQFGANGREVSADDVDVKVGVADDPDIAIDTVSENDDDFLIATASTNLEVWDFEHFGVSQKEGREIKVGGGVRYAELQHAYFGQDFDPTTQEYQTALVTDHTFEGAGPTFSMSVRHQVANTGFNIDFGGRASVLFGNGTGDWQRLNAPSSQFPNGDTIQHSDNLRMIPVGELRLGLSYERALKHDRTFELGGGFEGQYWMNGGTPLNAGQDGATDSDRIQSPFTEDFGIMGYYFRAGFTF